MNNSILTFQAWSLWALLICISLVGCAEEFEVFAPEEKMWAVYGILNPDSLEQDIRISKVFQLEADAIEFAKTYDPSVSGLTVWIEGAGERYPARWVDSVVKTGSGGFGPTMGLYRISTPEGLIPEEVYTLHIRSEQDTSVHLTAFTRIPPRPRFFSPRISLGPNGYCMPVLAFEDSTDIVFEKSVRSTGDRAMRYQIRVQMRYKENGVNKVFTGGPTRLFENDEGCAIGRFNTNCYLFVEGWMIRSLENAFRDQTKTYELDTDIIRCADFRSQLSSPISLEVAALDTFLSTHIIVQDPRFANFNDYRQEYTNIGGSHRGVGIFGAINTDQIPIKLSSCGLYLLGFGERPFGICE